MKKTGLLLAFIVLCTSCNAQRKPLPYVVLVSFDGFRSDYVERFDLPNFRNFIRGGAAGPLIPSFPSKTFPNHYTLVTGLYPGNHGLVDNQFYDPDLKTFYSLHKREAVANSSFYGGVPLWRLARQNNIRAASFFWVGSELREEHLRPDHYFPYDEKIPNANRVDQVIEWLRMPEPERPHFITLYFSSPDTEAHADGPFAERTRQKLMELDSLLGKMMTGIEETNLPVNVILVSDHGLRELVQSDNTYIFIGELISTERKDVIVVNGGTQAHVYCSINAADSLERVLKANAQDFTVLRRKDFPTRWHYDHERSGEILLLANTDKIFIGSDRDKFLRQIKPGKPFGVHGYDPVEVSDMNGIFYAKGPNIKSGIVLAPFVNVHIYPFIAEILQLHYGRIDGDPEVLKEIYIE